MYLLMNEWVKRVKEGIERWVILKLFYVDGGIKFIYKYKEVLFLFCSMGSKERVVVVFYFWC